MEVSKRRTELLDLCCAVKTHGMPSQWHASRRGGLAMHAAVVAIVFGGASLVVRAPPA